MSSIKDSPIAVGLLSLFHKKKPEEKISLDALYFRLYMRQNRLRRWGELKDAPQVIVDHDKELLAQVEKQIEERHAEIKERAIQFGRI